MPATDVVRQIPRDDLPAYKPRFIRCRGVWSVKGWSIKTYMTSAYEDRIATDFQDAAKALISSNLTSIEAVAPHHRLGFMIVTHGTLGNWVMLDWWSGILLYQRIYRAQQNDPWRFVDAPRDLIQCIWELRVTAFERQAWIDHMLANPNGPNPSAYLGAQLNIDV